MQLNFAKFSYQKNLAEQRDLFIECFPENIGTSVETNEHYFWKFHSAPFQPRSYEYIACNGKELIGYYAALPYQYSINGQVTSVGMVCDVMTGIKARGKGVFTKIGSYSTEELKNAGIPFTTGYPIRKEVIPGHIKVGWKIVHELPLYINIIKVNHLPIFKKVRLLSAPVNFLLAIRRLLYFMLKTNYEVKILSIDDFLDLDNYDVFFSRWRTSKTNYLIKSREFLKWRLGAPGKQYNVISLFNKNELVGIAIVTKVVKEGVPSLAVLDFMILDENYKLNYKLHYEIERYAIAEKLETVLVMMSAGWAKKYRLLKSGYLKSPYKFFLIIKKLSDQFRDEELFNAENWHLMWIDSDDL